MGLGVDTGTSSQQFTTLAWSYWVTYLLSQPLAGYVLQKLPVAMVLGWNGKFLPKARDQRPRTSLTRVS